MRRFLLAALGLVALLTTAAVVGIHVVLALHISRSSPGRATSIVSAALEGIVFVGLGWLLSSSLSVSLRDLFNRWSSVSFGVTLLVITLATATAVATMICLSKSTTEVDDTILGTKQTSFLIGSSIALGITFATQLVFVVVHFVLMRASSLHAHSLRTNDSDRRSPVFHVKSIPYSQTNPSMSQMRGMNSLDSHTPPPSIGGRSRAETMTSIRSSLSHAIRPITSKTRLLSIRRPPSLDSNAYRTSGEDAFDSWDTSSVDAHNRQTVLEATSPPFGKPSFLETIPASPTVSRTPSPANTLDLEPPRPRPRSRSFSPASSTRRERPALTEHASTSELHIHPLFRSDSPTPPPVATPGTVVVASPNAGQVITPRQSMRSLNRMRSGSLPPTPSPLSREGSLEAKKPRDEPSKIDGIEEERKMTPPIPEWILEAGSRTSLTGYNSRKQRIDG